MDKSLAQRIIKTRSSLGWTQNELAQASGVAAAQISRYEQGRSQPRTEVISKLANALNVKFEWLLKGEGEIDANLPMQDLPRPNGWAVEALELPQETIEDLQRFAKENGITTEAMLSKVILSGLKAWRDEHLPDEPKLASIEKRLARIEAAVGVKKLRDH